MPMMKPDKKRRACEYNHVLFPSNGDETFQSMKRTPSQPHEYRNFTEYMVIFATSSVAVVMAIPVYP
jgi:hypothetical protein